MASTGIQKQNGILQYTAGAGLTLPLIVGNAAAVTYNPFDATIAATTPIADDYGYLFGPTLSAQPIQPGLRPIAGNFVRWNAECISWSGAANSVPFMFMVIANLTTVTDHFGRTNLTGFTFAPAINSTAAGNWGGTIWLAIEKQVNVGNA